MADPFQFAGGLSQEDWFQLGSNTAMTGGAQAAYNQAGYYACATMRQQQVYQEKNYHLSWASVARDDVRGVMQASSNRLANYILVGTLILQTAVSMYLNDSMPVQTPDFVRTAFWTSTALSVLFFTTSIALAVKGQNTAFLATTRLLCWEIRPENPAAYDFDYMHQVNRFESLGMKEVFRLPGWMTRWHGEERIPEDEPRPDLSGKTFHSFGKSEAHAGTDATFNQPRPLDPWSGEGHHSNAKQDEDEKYEVLHPETDELRYLARFGRYMQLWQTYDTHSKYCIGLGLICMSQGASFWCLGHVAAETDNRAITDWVGGIMVTTFTFICVISFRQSFAVKRVSILAWLIFGLGPVLALSAVYVEDPPWLSHVLRLLFMLSYSFTFIAGYFLSLRDRPREAVERFIIGPNGQTFHQAHSDHEHRLSHSPLHGMHEGSEGAHFDKSEWGSTVDGFTDFADDSDYDSDADSELTCSWRGERSPEEVQADRNNLKVARMFRYELLFAALVWIAMGHCYLLAEFETLGLWAEGLASIPRMQVKDLPMKWPNDNFRPLALACKQGRAFAANAFQVFELNLTTGATVEFPCKLNTTIQDLDMHCESGSSCHPLALAADGQIIDCVTGDAVDTIQLDKTRKLALKVESQREFAGLANSTLMTVNNGYFVQSVYDSGASAWVPLWKLGSAHEVSDRTAGTQCGQDGRRLQAAGHAAVDPLQGQQLAAQSRRLRPTTHASARSRTSMHGARGAAAAVIVARTSRPGVFADPEEGASSTNGATDTLHNMAYSDEGLWLFRSASTARGWADRNLVTLVEVPALNVLRQWHLAQTPKLLAGCHLGQNQVLLLQGQRPVKVMLGSVDPGLYS